MQPVPTFVINLKKRRDRKNHILKEFAGRNEFSLSFVEPLPHEIGAVSLWLTVIDILSNKTKATDDYILVCEDDHQFTPVYNKDLLFSCIAEAKHKQADFLIGGVHWFGNGLQITDNLLWVDRFTATQFIIIFNHFFEKMINANFGENDLADHMMGKLTDNKFCINPFISIQKDFGYSDATDGNNTPGTMQNLFAKSTAAAHVLKTVSAFYGRQSFDSSEVGSFDGVSIPTYIVLGAKSSGSEKCLSQFDGKNEFDLQLITACSHEKQAMSLWLTLRKIVKNAISNEDDLIIICSDDHDFTQSYSKEFLLQNIVSAHQSGADLLLGGVGSFGFAVPVTNNTAWLNHFYKAQFTVLYQSSYQKIIDEPFDAIENMDFALSGCLSNKMIVFPFISEQPDFSELDFKLMRDKNGDMIESLKEQAEIKLKRLYDANRMFTI